MVTAGTIGVQADSGVAVHGRVQADNLWRGRVKVDGRTYGVEPYLLGVLSHLPPHVWVSLWLNGQGRVRAIDAAGTFKSGVIAAITASAITVSGTTYPLSSQVVIEYQGYVLTPQMVPSNSPATIRITRDGAVSRVWLDADPELPARPVLQGNVTSISGTSMVLDGFTLPIASSAKVREGDHWTTLSAVHPNDRVMVRLGRTASVIEIWIRNQGVVPGVVAADTSSTVTVGTVTYPYAASVTIDYRGYRLTPTQVPVGSEAVLRLNAQGAVAWMALKTDALLPPTRDVTGTISAISGNTVTLAGYPLVMAPTYSLTFMGTSTLADSVESGETATAQLNAAGLVDHLQVDVPAANP
jgi:hypothetical protein